MVKFKCEESVLKLHTCPLMICILFVFLSALSGVAAQPSDGDGEESEYQYNFCVFYLDYNQDEPSKESSSQMRWHYVSNKTPYKLSVNGGGVSRDYTYKGASNVTFYNELIKKFIIDWVKIKNKLYSIFKRKLIGIQFEYWQRN